MASKRISLVLCAAWIFVGASAAIGQPESPASAAAQPLAEALSDFAARTGLQVVYVSETVAPVMANAVPPGLAPEDTLERMLRGTGLKFEYLNARTVRIFVDRKRQAAATGDAASVGRQSPLGHGPGAYAGLEEVVVTATHQARWASDVPISLTVWSQDEMRISGVKSILEISAFTPGLSFDWRSNLGAGVYTALDMRGITGTHGVSTGVFIDDTTLPSATNDSYQRAFPATFDLERVEVLRGAQGMLLGQRTLGGAIRFITSPPSLSEFSGNATAEMATTKDGTMSYEAGVAAGGPVVDGVLGIRVSGWYRSDGGFVDRLDPVTSEPMEDDANDVTSKSGRIGMTWMPTDATRMTTTLIYDSNRANDQASFSIQQSDPEHGIFRHSNSIQQPREDSFYLASFKLQHGSDEVDLVAVSSYIDRDNYSIHDLNCCGATILDFIVDGNQQTVQQELRLASADADAKFTWVAGAHLSRTESANRLGFSDVPLEEREGTRFEQSQVEGYLELSGKLVSHLEASAGARLVHSSYEYVSLPTPVFAGGNHETLLIPRFNLSYHGESGSLFYLTAARGYGAGSVVGVIPGCEPLELLADTLWNYELGSKADILDGRAHVEVSVFDARWGNRQREPVAFACLTSWQKGRAESSGFELSGQALVGERTTIGLAMSYIDARYTQSVEAGGVVIVHAGDAVHNGRLPWSLSAFLDHEFPPIFDTGIALHIEDHYHGGNSRKRLEENPDSPFYGAFGNADSTTNILNARVNMKIGPAEVGVFVNNALNSSPLLNEFPFFDTAYTLTPRTVGIYANWHF